MPQPEELIEELMYRMSTVSGVEYTARNPNKPPEVSNLPCIQVFELTDSVEEASCRGAGAYPSYRRKLNVIIEMFLKASAPGPASQELRAFVVEMKKKLYEGGITLGGTCSGIKELESGRVLRPPIGENAIGIGIALVIEYVETIGDLF